jgi:hypothetical protein
MPAPGTARAVRWQADVVAETRARRTQPSDVALFAGRRRNRRLPVGQVPLFGGRHLAVFGANGPGARGAHMRRGVAPCGSRPP